MLHHYSFNWSNIESLPANYFLIYSDHFRLHFHKIRQSQLTISWVTMVTSGTIVFRKVLWVKHLQIIFDFNAWDMVEVFKSMLIVMNWHKTEIAQYIFINDMFSMFVTR